MRQLALVTGASSGIGLELARQFAQNGFDVIINAEDDELATAEASLAGEGAEVRAVRADLSTYDGVEQLWSAVASAGRPLDAVALNAGIGVNGDFARDIPLEDDLRLIAVNVTAVVHLAKRVLPAMIERGAGRVLVTSSVAATMPGPDTEFFDRAGMDDTKVAEAKKDDPAEVAKDGFEALMAGKDRVIAGSAKNKAQVAGDKILPETARAAMHAAQTKPDQRD
jgi:uncharacterized protein